MNTIDSRFVFKTVTPSVIAKPRQLGIAPLMERSTEDASHKFVSSQNTPSVASVSASNATTEMDIATSPNALSPGSKPTDHHIPFDAEFLSELDFPHAPVVYPETAFVADQSTYDYLDFSSCR